tara:strand:+ start:340 stop:717 length:378 start_codon:yes stop_codon:yes gene_type:complete
MIIRGIGKKYYKAISFFGEKLGLPDSILIDFSYSNTMPQYGLCWRQERKHFRIQLRTKQAHRNLLDTIAHEMVHVKQYIRNEINDSLNTWKGQYMRKDEPWEKEAEDLAICLVNQFTGDYFIKVN